MPLSPPIKRKCPSAARAPKASCSAARDIKDFKGTGNSELILDRKVAHKRAVPAIDIARSGTHE